MCPWLPSKAPFSCHTYKMVNHKPPFWNKYVGSFLIRFNEIPIKRRRKMVSVICSFFQNTLGCQLLMMLTKYFRLTNYTWMFCEGYYLHRLLANTFEEERSLAFILSIGWGKTDFDMKNINFICPSLYLQEFLLFHACCMEFYVWSMTTKCVGPCLLLILMLNGSTWHQDCFVSLPIFYSSSTSFESW